MTDYTKTTDFTSKDSLPSGDSGKIIRGAEFGTEFDNIETAVNSKSNIDNPSFTGNITVTGTVDGRDIAADGTKLDTIETSADVTDTANVTAAGAVMDSELTDITAVKALNQGVATTDSPTFAAVTSTGNVTVGGTVDGRDVAADGTKLDTVETNADVTDTANVTAAGALMDSEVTNLDQVKAFDSADYATAAQGTTADNALPKTGGAMTGAITTNSTFDGRDVATDGTKLDGIEALADVTDTANVTAAGALMDSELTSEASVKALNQGVATTDSPTFDGLTVDSSDVTIATFQRDGGGSSSSFGGYHIKFNAENSQFGDNYFLGVNLGGGFHLSTDSSNLHPVFSATSSYFTFNKDVGINTSSPDAELHIYKNASSAEIKVQNNDGVSKFHKSQDDLIISNDDTGDILFNVTTSETEAMRITSTGIDVNGTVEFDGLSGTGAVTVTDILDQDDMSSNSATALATQQSIKSYVDSQVATSDTLAEVLANGNTTGGTDVAFGDNDKAVFGAGSDLEIYHSSNQSIIKESGAGSLLIQGDNIRLQKVDGSENMITAVNDGAVTLYDNGSAKLATTATGIDVTGVITTDGMTTSADINFGDNDKAIFGASSDLQIYHDGSHSYVSDQGTGRLVLNSSGGGVRIEKSPTENMAIFTPDGNCELFYDNSLKLATTSTGIDVTGSVTADGLTVDTDTLYVDATNNRVGIGTSNPSTTLEVTGTGDAETGITATHARSGVGYTLLLNNTNNGANKGSGIKWQSGGFDTGAIITRSDATAASGDAPAYMTFHTSSDGSEDLAERMRIDSSGTAMFKGGTTNNAIQIWESNSEIARIGGSSGTLNFLVGSTTESRMAIDSSGNVGIGVVPSSPLHVNVGTNQNLEIDSAGSELRLSAVNDARSTNPAIRFQAESYKFYGAGGVGPRATIDSSGNLLVGKSVANLATVGVESSGGGYIRATRDGNSLTLNRLNTDGNIATFTKDGSSVGSIFSHSSGNMGIGTGATGVLFAATSNSIQPWNPSSNAARDATQDLGTSGNRFKDLYLSGGAYLGGVASANKLDDYEEGTWTPTYSPQTSAFTSVTYDAAVYGKYVKVGAVVHIQGIVRTDAISGGSGAVYIGGMPFTADNYGVISIGYTNGFAGDNPVGLYTATSSTDIIIRYRTAANSALDNLLDVTDLNTGGNSNYIIFSGTYTTTA